MTHTQDQPLVQIEDWALKDDEFLFNCVIVAEWILGITKGVSIGLASDVLSVRGRGIISENGKNERMTTDIITNLT